MSENLFHDRYVMEHLLGKGGFSEVWLAKDSKTDIEVALKIYAPGSGLDSHGINVLSREFAIVANANHRNLLKPLHYDVVDRKPYLVLPYCKKGSIQGMVGQFTEEEAWHLIHDVASALAYLHSRNPVIIHQDIKPANIMMDDGGDYMLSDFGISSHARSALRKSMSVAFTTSVGTTAYMPPERFEADNTPIKASDIWSLGAMIYEMLVGDVPFATGDIEGGLLQKKGAEIPLLPKKYSPALRRLIELCLQKDPWVRPTAEQIEQYAQIALEGGDPFASKRFSKKTLNLIYASAASFILILLIIVAAMSIHRKKEQSALIDQQHRELIRQQKERATRQVYDLMDRAAAAVESGKDYDKDYYENDLMQAYSLYDEAEQLALTADSLLADSVRGHKELVRAELDSAILRFRTQQREAISYHLQDSAIYRRKAESVQKFIKDHSQ